MVLLDGRPGAGGKDRRKGNQVPGQEAGPRRSTSVSKVTANCPISGAVDLGSWCLEASTFKVPATEIGQNNYIYAAQKCVKEGGWLPTAAQLIGAAPKAALKSTVDDDPGSSGASEFPEAEERDQRRTRDDLGSLHHHRGLAGRPAPRG